MPEPSFVQSQSSRVRNTHRFDQHDDTSQAGGREPEPEPERDSGDDGGGPAEHAVRFVEGEEGVYGRAGGGQRGVVGGDGVAEVGGAMAEEDDEGGVRDAQPGLEDQRGGLASRREYGSDRCCCCCGRQRLSRHGRCAFLPANLAFLASQENNQRIVCANYSANHVQEEEVDGFHGVKKRAAMKTSEEINEELELSSIFVFFFLFFLLSWIKL